MQVQNLRGATSSQCRNLFSIIIPNFNGENFLHDCLQSIMRSRYAHFEVIVVDNNSTDNSLEILRQFVDQKRIRLLPLEENVHYAKANNIGIKHSKGEFLIFLNNDTKVDENWLEGILGTFTKDKQIDAVQCMVRNMVERETCSKGGTLDYSGRLIPVEYLWQRNANLESERRIFWGTGAALAIRRSALDRVHGFDPNLPTDEVDLCWRINLSGGKIELAPKAIVYHYGSASFGNKLNARRVYYGEISMLTALLRNFGLQSLFRALAHFLSFLPMAIILDVIVRRRADVLLSRIEAYFHVLKDMRKILSQRLFVQRRIRRVDDAQIRRLMVKPNPLLYLRHSQKV